MKKIVAAALSLLLVVMCGCNNSSSDAEINDAAETQDQSTQKKLEEVSLYPNKLMEQYDKPDASKMVDVSWFDDCVFIGDSITSGLSLYNDGTDTFGEGIFICAGSLSYSNAVLPLDDPNAVHPSFKNVKILSEQAAEVTGSNKAIVTLGMNDVGVNGAEAAFKSAVNFIERLRMNSPECTIYLQTVTPMIKRVQIPSFNNDIIKEFNGMLEKYAEEQNLKFLNSYEVFADKDGNLPEEYCGDVKDQGIHFNNESYRIWANFIMMNVDPVDGGGLRREMSEMEEDSDGLKLDGDSMIISYEEIPHDPEEDDRSEVKTYSETSSVSEWTDDTGWYEETYSEIVSDYNTVSSDIGDIYNTASDLSGEMESAAQDFYSLFE